MGVFRTVHDNDLAQSDRVGRGDVVFVTPRLQLRALGYNEIIAPAFPTCLPSHSASLRSRWPHGNTFSFTVHHSHAPYRPACCCIIAELLLFFPKLNEGYGSPRDVTKAKCDIFVLLLFLFVALGSCSFQCWKLIFRNDTSQIGEPWKVLLRMHGTIYDCHLHVVALHS